MGTGWKQYVPVVRHSHLDDFFRLVSQSTREDAEAQPLSPALRLFFEIYTVRFVHLFA